MPVSVYSNFDRICVLEETNSIIRKLDINDRKSYLFFVFTGNTETYLSSLYQCLLQNKNCDVVIAVFLYEAPDFFKCINHLAQLVEQIFRKKFGFVDYGADFGNSNHFCFNNFIDENHNSWIPTEPQNRKYKWFCANRILKPHRINLLKQLIKLQQKDNIITAGNYAVNQKFLPLIDFDLPLRAPDELTLNDSSFESSRYVPESFKNSVFNLVTESSFENIGDVFETWSRLMITEKTIKAYRLYQIPIFLAPAGHVDLQRKLGFDMFDDIVDHTYDLCTDPFHRINMVIEQCKKINQIDIQHWTKIIAQNWQRLIHNNNNCAIARTNLENFSISKFRQWTKN